MKKVLYFCCSIVIIASAFICVYSTQPHPIRARSREVIRLNRLIRFYSQQKNITFDINDSFTLKNNTSKVITLMSVKEYKDSVIHLIRRAIVSIDIDGTRHKLPCGPYVMPVKI